MSIKIKQPGAVDGFYQIKVKRNAGKLNEFIEDCGVSANLLTDGFFSRWLSASLSPIGWRFFVGSGTTPPANSNTQLQTQIGNASGMATVTPNGVVKEGDDYFSSSTGVAEWTTGAIVGNISEIGGNLRNETSGGALDTRALVVDGAGDPTTITLTSEDQLVVSYTLRYRIPTTQHSSTVDFDDVTTQCTLETLGVYNNSHWGISELFRLGGAFALATSVRISAAAGLRNDVEFEGNIGSSAQCDHSVSSTGSARRVSVTAAASQLNGVGDIKYLGLNTIGGFSRQGIMFDPPLNKTNTKPLTLHFDYTLTRG